MPTSAIQWLAQHRTIEFSTQSCYLHSQLLKHYCNIKLYMKYKLKDAFSCQNLYVFLGGIYDPSACDLSLPIADKK